MVGPAAARRFEVWLVNLDPTVGKEIKKTRPCLILSPDEANRHLDTVIAAPMTTVLRSYPTRVNCRFQGKKGQLVLEQIRAIDKARLVVKLGRLDKTACQNACALLQEMFSYA
jgi:mRNA interferase MazF